VPQRHQQQAGAAAAAGGRARGAVPRALYVCTLYVYVRVYVRAPAAWTGSAGVPRSAYPAPPAGPLRGRLRRGPPGAVPLDLRVPRRLQSAGSAGVGGHGVGPLSVTAWARGLALGLSVWRLLALCVVWLFSSVTEICATGPASSLGLVGSRSALPRQDHALPRTHLHWRDGAREARLRTLRRRTP